MFAVLDKREDTWFELNDSTAFPEFNLQCKKIKIIIIKLLNLQVNK
jgi:hypothetical protein